MSQPVLMKLALKPYQLASVGWMSAIEQHTSARQHHHTAATDVAGDWLCGHVMKCQSVESSLLFDVVGNRILCEPLSPHSRLANFTLTVSGGILAGMVTASLLCYLYSTGDSNCKRQFSLCCHHTTTTRGVTCSFMDCRTVLCGCFFFGEADQLEPHIRLNRQ